YAAMPQSAALSTCLPGHVGEMTEAERTQRTIQADTSFVGTISEYEATSAMVQFKVAVNRYIQGDGTHHVTFMINQNYCNFIPPHGIADGETATIVVYGEHHATAYVGQWIFFNGRVTSVAAPDSETSWAALFYDAGTSGLALTAFVTLLIGWAILLHRVLRRWARA
ncbi:MAG: hypothetical protein AAF653_09715, partial [Chloroflexota bacterium]